MWKYNIYESFLAINETVFCHQEIASHPQVKLKRIVCATNLSIRNLESIFKHILYF